MTKERIKELDRCSVLLTEQDYPAGFQLEECLNEIITLQKLLEEVQSDRTALILELERVQDLVGEKDFELIGQLLNRINKQSAAIGERPE